MVQIVFIDVIVNVDRIAFVESKEGKNVQICYVYILDNYQYPRHYKRTMAYYNRNLINGNKGGETGYVSDSGILLYCYRVGRWACWSKEGSYII